MQAPSNAGSAAAAAAAPLKGVFFHTHNVARALKPSGDGELAHALHETLHFALDGEEEDWGPQRDMLPDCGDAVQEQQQQPQSGKASQQGDQEPTPRPGFFPTGNPERPYISYAWNERTSTLSLPNPTTIFNPTKLDPCSPEQRSAFDVTVKFFYLPQSDEGDAVGAGAGAGAGVNGTASGIGEEGKERYPKHYIDDALKRLTMATSLITFDTFIIAFPGLALDAGGHKNGSGAPVCGAGGAAAADVSEITTNGTSNGANGTQEEVPERLRENVEEVRKIWESISPHPQLLSLGLSDLSLPALRILFSSFNPQPPPPSDPHAYNAPSAIRRPKFNTINVKEDPCSVDKELSAWCQKEGVQLVAHSDRRDTLPAHTLPNLMSEFQDTLPHPLPSGSKLSPRWVLKYTVLIRDRGVVADKGYILFAEAT